MRKTEIKDLYSVMFPEYPDVVNVEQLSEMLGGVSTKTVYRLLKKGEIQSKYVGKRYLTLSSVKDPSIFLIRSRTVRSARPM